MQHSIWKKLVAVTATVATLGLGAMSASASDLETIFAEITETNRMAQASQVRIDDLSEETAALLQEYKRLLKEIDGLRVYNAQLERNIANQEADMADLRASIERVTLIERQITPLMIRMIDGLEAFIVRDLPFDRDERLERVERLREIMDQADVAPSEKLRLVFEAYQIENGFGRTIEATEGVLRLGNADRQVSILRIGRVVLAYQTIDGSEQGVWSTAAGDWVELGSGYATAIRNGIRVASQQASPTILNLPVQGPEDIQ